MFDQLRGDIARWRQDNMEQGWWKRYDWIATLRYLLNIGMAPVIVYRFEHWVYKRVRIPVARQVLWLLGVLVRRFVMVWTGVVIFRKAEIGPGLKIHTWYGIFIGAPKIGKNCTVGTGVLINCGTRSIGDNVYFGAGAKVVGDVAIGNNVVIMPNSLVITDVADNTTIVGVPARIKLRGGRPQRFNPAIGKAPTPAPPPASATEPARTAASGNGSTSQAQAPATALKTSSK